MAQQRRSRHRGLCAHQQGFDRLIHALDAGRRGERAAHLSGERADPRQRQPNLRRRAKVKVAAEPHREKVNVGLVEPIEQREVVRPASSRRRAKSRIDSEPPKSAEFRLRRKLD